jgi:predicted nucleotide-binding protein (sugar kinase/HSP70/actin superfamily)
LTKRVGICRALHAYHHYACWRTFFQELGWEVVLSAPTGRQTVERGVRLAPSELCLPVKAFLGHVTELKDRVDALFLPRIVCRGVAGDRYFGCPKAIALPDLTRAVFESLPPIIEPVLDDRERTEEESFRAAVSGPGRAGDVGRAWRSAGAAGLRAARATGQSGSPLGMFGDAPGDAAGSNARVRIGVVGHSYLLFDPGLSLNVVDKVRSAGAQPVLVFPTAGEIEQEARRRTAPNWYYELELLAAARRLLESEKVDGLLLVASFACGTGAVTNELIRREAVHHHRTPTVLLLLDEHSGEAGLVTRVESFVDVLEMRAG